VSRILAAFAVVVSLLAAGPAAAASHAAPSAQTPPHAAAARGGEQDPGRFRRARNRAFKAYRQARADAHRLGRKLHRPRIHRIHRVRHLNAATRRWRRRDAHLRRLLDRRTRAIDAARGAVGVPYVYGGASPGGFDCSGLVMWSYRHAGVRLPHSSTQQMRRGQRVSHRGIRPGDLVFSYSGGHVGVYAGHGVVIAAPHPGTVVQRQPLRGWSVTEVRRLI
jgi:cell wall-associated NlpC family hydrolase